MTMREFVGRLLCRLGIHTAAVTIVGGDLECEYCEAPL